KQTRERLLETLNQARRNGDRSAMAATLQNLGEAEQQIGNYKEALRLLKLSRESFKAIKDNAGMVAALNRLGQLMQQIDRYDEAEGFYREALRASEQINDVDAVMTSVLGLSQVLVSQEHRSSALLLLAHLLHNPQVKDSIMDAAEQLVFQLEDAIPPEEAASAWEKGKSTSLTLIVTNEI
ncbi:MAG: tetratricopeptide repeat protein, partial [Chloroflexota bacterium]